MRRYASLSLVLGLVLGPSCAEQVEEEALFTPLSPREQLIRLSLDLRGVRPSPVELESIEAHPELYDNFAERYIEDPRFLERLREIFNLRYLTRNGSTYFDPEEAGFVDVDTNVLAETIADEPLRLVSHIAENDLSFTEIVLADYTMASPMLAQMWSLELDDPSYEGWQPATYQDGRPHTGLLTMNTIWQRYPSMGGNANRHRANAVSKMLLCDDYLTRPIVLNRAAVDQLTLDPEDAIAANVACQSCHSTLDPLAAHFFGFFTYEDAETMEEHVTYRPELEELWREHADKSPAYFGRPTGHLEEMAVEMAADPRLSTCAVKTVFEGLTQRAPVDGDWSELREHQDVFDASGMRLKPLVLSVVLSDAYRAVLTSDAELAERLPTLKTVSPRQLADSIEDATGYRWTFRGQDGLESPARGLPALAGGVDGNFVTERSYDPSVGLVYIQERLAWSAAWDVASRDLAVGREGPAQLLAYVTIEDTPETAPAAFEAQIRDLYLQVVGLPLAEEAEEPEALVALWKEIYSVDASPTAAWAGVLTAVLRDPRMVLY